MINWRHLVIEVPVCVSICKLADALFTLQTVIKISLIIIAVGITCIWMDKRKHKNG